MYRTVQLYIFIYMYIKQEWKGTQSTSPQTVSPMLHSNSPLTQMWPTTKHFFYYPILQILYIKVFFFPSSYIAVCCQSFVSASDIGGLNFGTINVNLKSEFKWYFNTTSHTYLTCDKWQYSLHIYCCTKVIIKKKNSQKSTCNSKKLPIFQH